jgi:hypothetical protein
LLPVVVTDGLSDEDAALPFSAFCEKVTDAPPIGVPRSFTVAVSGSLFPLAACVEFSTVRVIEVGVDERSGETCALNEPRYDCGWPEEHCERLALGQGMALSVTLPEAREPRAIALIGTLTSHIIAPPSITRLGVQDPTEEVPL